jgi:hypothetical protein
MTNDVTKDANSTRRSFLKGGALLAAPLAAAVPAAILADDGTKARLAKLENEAAIRELHQGWVRGISTGARDEAAALFSDPKRAAFDPTVRSIAPDHAGEPDAIEVAADGRRAAGRFHCAVETETAIAPDSTLAQMAHAQGGGYIRRWERRVLRVEYVKSASAWAISKAELAPA